MALLKFLIMLPYILYLAYKDKKALNGKIRLYGIYGYFGLPGRGKTISMTRRLEKIRHQYGSDVYIMTNYGYIGQDEVFSDWHQLLKDYNKPLVVAWDEVQNEFCSRNFKDFPISLMTHLTQVRKENGCMILYTSQRYHFVDKNFRSLSFGMCDCKCWLGRFCVNTWYEPEEYEQRVNTVSIDRKMKIARHKKESYLQTDELREKYSSYKMLQTAKSKDYMDRLEISEILAE